MAWNSELLDLQLQSPSQLESPLGTSSRPCVPASLDFRDLTNQRLGWADQGASLDPESMRCRTQAALAKQSKAALVGV